MIDLDGPLPCVAQDNYAHSPYLEAVTYTILRHGTAKVITELFMCIASNISKQS
jgi:hypothetical protein